MVAYVPNDKCCGIRNFCEPLKKCPQRAMSFLQTDASGLKGEVVVDEAKCDGCGDCLSLCRTNVVQLVSWGAV